MQHGSGFVRMHLWHCAQWGQMFRSCCARKFPAIGLGSLHACVATGCCWAVLLCSRVSMRSYDCACVCTQLPLYEYEYVLSMGGGRGGRGVRRADSSLRRTEYISYSAACVRYDHEYLYPGTIESGHCYDAISAAADSKLVEIPLPGLRGLCGH